MYDQRADLKKLLDGFAALAEDYFQTVGTPHEFIERLLRVIGWQPSQVIEFIRAKHLELGSIIQDRESTAPRLASAPLQRFCHKIWLTSPDSPHFPPSEYLPSYFSMCKGHPDDWTHMFWTNSEAVLKHVDALAAAAGAKICVQNIHSIPIGAIGSTLDRLISERKFVLAADVLKFVILDRFGGIYSDLGICFDAAALAIASVADYTFILANNLFFQTSWISARRHSLFSSTFLAILNNPEVLSAEYALDASGSVTSASEVHVFCGLGFTACVLLFASENTTIFSFTPHSKHLSWRSQQSWYGTTPKHGNVLIKNTNPTVLEGAKYRPFADAARERVTLFNADDRLRHKMQTIAGLFDYFQDHPTSLCKLLNYNHSTKMGSWHNYGCIYFFLLERFIGRRPKLLEIGDALDLWGRTPGRAEGLGGAVRAWRGFFDAEAFGVQIDRLSQITLSPSDTVLVDESYRCSLEEQLGRHAYDIIIDNGIHTFETAVTLLALGTKCLSSSGVYVIESVPLADIPRWKELLRHRVETSIIFAMPHPRNRVDNCLVAITKEAV